MLSQFFCSAKSKNNPFDSEEMAKHYDRPDAIYQGFIKRVVESLKIEKRLECALDVACGTGISTRALKPLAYRIIGVDASPNMLACAKEDKQIEYQVAAAESLPFPDKSFDLVSICVAFHCVNQPEFMKEAARVLRDNGQLVICHTKFKGIETAEFSEWFSKVFYRKYPLSSGSREYSSTHNRSDDFSPVIEMRYPEIIAMDITSFVHLLMTTSGVFQAVEKNNENYETIEKWLHKELKPFFKEQEKAPFRIDMSIWCIKRIPRPDLTLANSNSNSPPLQSKL